MQSYIALQILAIVYNYKVLINLILSIYYSILYYLLLL